MQLLLRFIGGVSINRKRAYVGRYMAAYKIGKIRLQRLLAGVAWVSYR